MLYNPWLDKADPELLALLGMTESQLPRLLKTPDPAGMLSAEAASTASLPAGIPVSAAIHDQYAAALGSGAFGVGDVNFGSGTAWVLLAASEQLSQLCTPQAFVSTHAIAGRYGQLLSMGNGGSCFQWTVRTLGLEALNRGQIDELMSSSPVGSEGLQFLPHLAGPGVKMTSDGGGKLLNLKLSHQPKHILRAVVEGLAMELMRHLQALLEKGSPLRRLVMCGATSRSSVTPQVIADVTNLPIAVAAEKETSALGAAIVARCLAERLEDVSEVAGSMVHLTRTIQPSPAAEIYSNLYRQYESLVANRN